MNDLIKLGERGELVESEPPRLPCPHGLRPSFWRVLIDSIFPSAQTVGAIEQAIRYCHERNLDILKRPVHIVPQWNAKLRRTVEVIWPSITEAEITAARTGQWAGMDSPVYGEVIEREFSGYLDNHQQKFTVRYPEWCRRTVYRIIGGQRVAFTEEVRWIETYARVGGTSLPNTMWRKRSFDQLAKCAKGAALRSAFPEESPGPTAEEMEGQTIGEIEEIKLQPTDKWTPPEQVKSSPRPPEKTGIVRDEAKGERSVDDANESEGRSPQSGEMPDDYGAGLDPPQEKPHATQEAKAQSTTEQTPSQPAEKSTPQERPAKATTAPQTPVFDYDSETGEILDESEPPHTIEIEEGENIVQWGVRFVQIIRECKTTAEIEGWKKHNNIRLTMIQQENPKLSMRIDANVSDMINKLKPAK